MTSRIKLVTALAFAGPVAFALSACAALGGQSQDTGYGTSGNAYNRACHDEVMRRYGDLRSSDVSTRRANNDNYSTQVDWHTRSGGTGTCQVASDGSIVGFREDRSPYANGNYSSNQGGWTTDGSNNSDVARSQAEACRNQVLKSFQSLAASDVQANVQSTDDKGTSTVSWSTNRGDSGECIVNRNMEIAMFRKHDR